jgi:hypothetical protein
MAMVNPLNVVDRLEHRHEYVTVYVPASPTQYDAFTAVILNQGVLGVHVLQQRWFFGRLLLALRNDHKRPRRLNHRLRF